MSDISTISECITQPPYRCCGFILAGGMSSRMGTDKAHIRVGQHSLLEIAKSLLAEASVNQSYVIGGDQADIVETQSGMGPANAIIDVLRQIFEYPAPNGIVVFMPVDMPCFTATSLNHLIDQAKLLQKVVYFEEHFLPLAAPVGPSVVESLHRIPQSDNGVSVRFLLRQLNAQPIIFKGQSREMLNVNRPDDLNDIKMRINN